MREVETRDARRRQHREVLGQRDALRRRVEQLEEARLLAVVGAGGIAERRTDAAVALGELILERELLVLAVAPLAPHARVQPLGERLGEPIGERLHQDRVVVVEFGFEARGERVGADPGGDGEGADRVDDAALDAARRSRRATGTACPRRRAAGAASGSARLRCGSSRRCTARGRRRRRSPARSRRRRSRAAASRR